MIVITRVLIDKALHYGDDIIYKGIVVQRVDNATFPFRISYDIHEATRKHWWSKKEWKFKERVAIRGHKNYETWISERTGKEVTRGWGCHSYGYQSWFSILHYYILTPEDEARNRAALAKDKL